MDAAGREPGGPAARRCVVGLRRDQLPGRPLGGAQPGAGRPRGGRASWPRSRRRRRSAHRIHLATDNRIRSEDMMRIIARGAGRERAPVRSDALPQRHAAARARRRCGRLGEPKLASALEKLGTIFGGYGEWGQPIHDVGNDVRILGLPIRRPDTEHALPHAVPPQQATCRSSGACATPTRSRGASGSGSRRSTRIELRDRAARRAAIPRARVPAAAGRAASSSRSFKRALTAPGARASGERILAVGPIGPRRSHRWRTTAAFDRLKRARRGGPDAGLGRAHAEPALHAGHAGRAARARRSSRRPWRRRCGR